MKILDKIPQELKGLIVELQSQASAQNIKVYLVGGFVRDLILGFKNLDLDIVVEGDGVKFAQDFSNAHKGEITVHKRFGTSTVRLNAGIKIDFSSTRKEVYPEPGKLPVVSFASLKDDLFRRDFTINAMAISLKSKEIIDYFNGLGDLKNKKIRVLHGLSFKDDPTRILRAIRFEQRFGFSIEPITLKLIKEAVKLKMLEKVHPHRLRDEIILLLKEESPLRYIRRIEELSGFGFIHKRIKIHAKDYAYLKSLERELRWFSNNYPKRRGLDKWLIYFIGLLNPLSPAQIGFVCDRFGLRKGEKKRILSCKNASKKLMDILNRRNLEPSKVFALLEPLSYETIISLRAKSKSPILKRHIADFLEIYNGMCISVSGNDLRYLGLPPGPQYQKIFTEVLNAKLNGRVTNKNEELSLIKKLLEERGLN